MCVYVCLCVCLYEKMEREREIYLELAHIEDGKSKICKIGSRREAQEELQFESKRSLLAEFPLSREVNLPSIKAFVWLD